MRNPVSALFAVGLITAFVACANGSSDDPSTDTNGTDPNTDSGVGTNPASNGGGGGGGGGNNNTTDSGSGGGNTGTDSGGGGTGTDSGGGGAVDSGGGGTTMDQCDTNPNSIAGAAYLVAYFKLADPTAVPCPCSVGQCCFNNSVYPAACLKK